jgi:hypothetical protein
MDTSGLDLDRIKHNVAEHWEAEGWSWPVKVISAERGLALGASAWEPKANIPATVLKIAPAGQTL